MPPRSLVACVRIPRFPIGAVWHGTAVPDLGADGTDPPHWDTLPLALREGTRLRAVTGEGARWGVRPGMTVAQAQGKCAALRVLEWDRLVIARELARATAALLAAAPQVRPVPGAPGTWWVGAEGFEGLGGTTALGRHLVALARVWHPGARVGVAGSCVAARAATWEARTADGLCIVAPEREDDWLARAPLALVPLPALMREDLAGLGVRTAGALGAIPAGDVEARWGAAGVLAWRLARGDDPRRPTLTSADVLPVVATELAMAAESMEPVLFVVRAALDRMVPALARAGRAVAAVRLTLGLDGSGRATPTTGAGREVTREARAARAMARVPPLFERVRAVLDGWAVPAPIVAVEVAVTETAPLPAEQGDLLAPSWRDPAAVDAALERLRAALGPRSVVRPVARDAHAPERGGAWVETEVAEEPATGGTRGVVREAARAGARQDAYPRAAGSGAPAAVYTPATGAPATHPLLGEATLRLLEDPEAVAVEVAHGEPRTLRWRGRRIAIARAHGPERLSGDWWHAPFARDYWRCDADALGQEFLLYRDAAGWHLHGWYD